MSWRQFFAEILHYGAWPAVVLVGLYWLRKPIVAAVGRLGKIKHKDTVLEFSVKKIEKSVSRDQQVFADIGPDSSDLWKHYLDALEVGASMTGQFVLDNYGSSPKSSKLIRPIFYAYIKKVMKYRPDTDFKFLFSIKDRIDALDFDETT